MLLWPEDQPQSKRKRWRPNPTPHIPDTGWRLQNRFPDLSGAKVICFDVETKDPNIEDKGAGWGRGDGHVIGVALATDDGFKQYYPMRHEGYENHNAHDVLDYCREQLGRPHQPKLGHNIIYDLGWLEHEGVSINGDIHDTWTAAKLLDHSSSAALESLGQHYLGEGKESLDLYDWQWKAWGSGKPKSDKDLRKNAMSNLYRCPPSLVGFYGESDVELPIRIARKQFEELHDLGLWEVYRLECDLIPILVQMRLLGVSVDLDAAEQARDQLLDAAADLQRQVDDIAGRPINTGSPVEMEKVFTSLKIPFGRTENGKMSLTGAYLKTVEHPIGKLIVDLEELKKYESAFVTNAILNSHVNGRVHCQFNPLRAVTGRMSCVTGDTVIPTQRGNLPMTDLRVGDSVWTHKGRWKPVRAKWVSGVRETFELTFSDGCFLTCTKDHRLLTSSGDWVTVEELIQEYVNLPETHDRPGKNSNRPETLSRSENYDDKGNLEDCRHFCSKHLLHPEAQCLSARVQSSQGDALFRNEGWRQESDERQGRGGAPQLEGGLRRQSRIPDAKGRKQTLLRSSNSHGQGFGNAPIRATLEVGSPSHRRESSQQRAGQLGPMHEAWAQGDSRFTVEGCSCVKLTEVNAGRCVEVYDITVLDDASYAAGGVFSHNCSNPNLQQVPSRNDLAKKVRSIFVPDEGHDHWRKYDYSSIESRILAHFATGPGSRELRKEYRDNPDTDYHSFTQAMIKQLVGLELNRKHVKNVNFAGIYGASEKKLQSMMGLSDEEANTFFDAYHTGLPYVKDTMSTISEQAEVNGFTTTVMGRRALFDKWEPKYTPKGSERPFALPFKHAIKAYGPNIKRAYLHKALNYTIQGSAADLMKAAIVKCHKDGIYDEIGYPRLIVHDEKDWSVKPDWNEEAFTEMQHVMENVIKFRIPIRVEGEWGPNWSELYSLK